LASNPTCAVRYRRSFSLMLRIAHEKHNPQMTQMAADTQKPARRLG